MAEDEKNEVEEQVENVSPNGAGKSALSRLLNKDTLIPVAAAAATAAAAGLAAKKGPDIKNMIAGQAKDGAEELGGKAAEGAKEKVTGGGGVGSVLGGASKLLPGIGGGGSKGGKKKTRRLPIQRWTDVAVPVDVAYEKWTKFEDFPKFMHRVLKVEQDDDTVKWEEKIWFSKRQWEGKITDQRENDRIAWTTESGTSHTGIVSFHKLDDSLTRVLVTVDFQPAGMIEKMASGLRFVKRAVQSDLARFKAYVELDDAKGVEYEVAPSKDDQQDEDDDQKAQGDDDRKAQLDDESGDDDSEDRESEREEREERRRQRRETTTAA
jgi:uncharacterized membrane protein